jgi:hypothetical protein
MDTDTRCPSCGMVTDQDAGAAPPWERTGSAPGPRRRRSVLAQWGCGLLTILLGGFLGLVAWALYESGQEAPLTQPRSVTADELLNVRDVKDLPGPISYTFSNSIDTGMELVRTRIGSKDGTPKGRFLLVQVKDRWLITEVEPEFSGNKVVGELQKWSSPLSLDIIKKIEAKYPGRVAKMLPYQLYAVHVLKEKGSISKAQAALAALFAVILVCTGLATLMKRRGVRR